MTKDAELREAWIVPLWNLAGLAGAPYTKARLIAATVLDEHGIPTNGHQALKLVHEIYRVSAAAATQWRAET